MSVSLAFSRARLELGCHEERESTDEDRETDEQQRLVVATGVQVLDRHDAMHVEFQCIIVIDFALKTYTNYCIG